MSLLKQKIAKTLVKVEYSDEDPIEPKIEVKLEPEPQIMPQEQPRTLRKNQNPYKPSPQSHKSSVQTQLTSLEQKRKSANSSKNIVKNFARAMVTFTLSDLSLHYIAERLKQENINIKPYREYFKLRKECMDGISSLRALLLIMEDDGEEEVKYKKVFQYSCEVFIKCFSVNWIFHSKLGDKMAHVKSRFKMLRRIQKPEYFTYLKV